MFHHIFPVILEESISYETVSRTEKTNDIFDLKFISFFGCFLSLDVFSFTLIIAVLVKLSSIIAACDISTEIKFNF